MSSPIPTQPNGETYHGSTLVSPWDPKKKRRRASPFTLPNCLGANIQHPGCSNSPSGWWLNQPIWKIWSSNWIISPGIGVKIKNIWNHHLAIVIHLDPAGRPTKRVPKRWEKNGNPYDPPNGDSFWDSYRLTCTGLQQNPSFCRRLWQFIANQNDM